jgi:hypothetical protein
MTFDREDPPRGTGWDVAVTLQDQYYETKLRAHIGVVKRFHAEK